MSDEQTKAKPEQIALFLSSRPNVWHAASIDAEPEVKLYDWCIKKTDKGEYFVGSNDRDGGRVSTQIMEFDEEKMIGRTKSGRVYQLQGPAGYSSDGEYVWSYYKKVNELTEVE